MDQAFDTRLEFDKRSERFDAAHPSGDIRPLGVLGVRGRPGVAGELPHAEADLLALGVDRQDLDFDLLAFLEDIPSGWLIRTQLIWPT